MGQISNYYTLLSNSWLYAAWSSGNCLGFLFFLGEGVGECGEGGAIIFYLDVRLAMTKIMK